jgi:hypothetical protein
MPLLEGQVDAVIGVDTPRDTHAAALLDANGGVRATLEVPGDRAGHARLLQLLQLADEQASGRRVWALEGTGCYDRQLNRALHTIVMLRQTHHGPTRAYTSRRIAQGKSQREIRRCLKRTVARQLYRLLERTATN